MDNVVSMDAIVYPMYLFELLDVLLSYTLSNLFKGGAHGYTFHTFISKVIKY